MAASLVLSACRAAAGGLVCALGATLLRKRKRALPDVADIVEAPLEGDKVATSEAATERVPTDVVAQGASGDDLQDVASPGATAPKTAARSPGAARRPPGASASLSSGSSEGGGSSSDEDEEEGGSEEDDDSEGWEEGSEEDCGKEGHPTAAEAAAAAAAAAAGVAGPWHTVRRDASKEAEAVVQASGSGPDSLLEEPEIELEGPEEGPEEEQQAPAKRARREPAAEYWGPLPPALRAYTVVEGWKEEEVEDEQWEVELPPPTAAVAVTTAEEWEAQLQRSVDLPAVVAFSAAWPPECLVSQPLTDELLARLGGDATLVTVDVDDAADVAEACGVQAIPCFQVWQYGVKVGEHVGADRQRLLATLDSLL